ncbi:FAD-binding oxidoreductase [Actinoplanes sp. NPDC024001]|uniref:FAD-binding oxidoreductase n=1 Tax=Actinoplanes sp. NPDC024001 TaxID=3154598 RepID=UPI003410B20F
MGKRLLLYSLPILFPLPLVLVLNGQMNDAQSVRLYVSAGVFAYGWWLLAVLLSVRPSWLDRAVGLPLIYGLHGLLAVFAIGAAYLHQQNTFSPGLWAQRLGNWGFYAALALLCYSVLFMSGWLTDRSQLAHRIKNRLEVVFRHQLSVWIHRLNLVVIALIWLHVHLIDRVSQHFAFMALFDLYTVTVFGIYVWKKWVAPDAYLGGTVTVNTALNGSTRQLSIALDRPATTARPGDFYFLRFDGPGISRERHPFSATDASRETLTFTIRSTGDFTRTAAEIPVGTRVSVEGPFGRFDPTISDQPADTPLVLVGMGAGVAPLLSLTAGHLPHRRIHLLWSIRNTEDAYYRTLLEDHQRRADGRFTFTTQVGRFRAQQLPDILTPEQVRDAAFFVVGPNPAVLSTQRMLRRAGVAGARIHHERLTM